VLRGQRALLQAYTPPSMLMGSDRELLHVYGAARDFLHLGEGNATLDVVKLLPRELSWAASLLLQAVLREDAPQRAAPVTLGSGTDARRLRMVARRLAPEADAPPSSAAPVILLSFEPWVPTTRRAPATSPRWTTSSASVSKRWNASSTSPTRACSRRSRNSRRPTRSCRPRTKS
jgi:hypothetical protein